MDTELVGDSEVRAESSEIKEESSSKRTREELESDKSKKQKLDEKEVEVDDAKEAEELKQCLEIVLDDGDDVTIDATPLSVKIPIVDYKIYQEGKKSFFKIIKADGKTQGKIIGIKSLLEVTAVKELVTAVSAAGMKVTTVSVESYNC
ncbi:hypothetical protein Tco_0657343 [Tanacetum coccineum]|uniref:Uncharacterized protein n=1 Tax=Tanacetum coccineum TaxID=301880 RepID=A0ABQ4XBC0_9ASTR